MQTTGENHLKSSMNLCSDDKLHIALKFTLLYFFIGSFNSSVYGFCVASLFPTDSMTYLVSPTGEQSSITFYNYDTTSVLNTYEHKKIKCKLENASEMCMCMKVFLKETKLYLLLGYDSGFLSLWDYEANAEQSRLKCHSEVLLCLDYDPRHRNRGISGSVDNILQAWKIEANGQLVHSQRVTIMNPGINAVKIRGDGKIVITAGQDKAIRVFSWKSLKPLAVLVWHRKPVFSLAWSNDPSNRNFATGSKDRNICVASIYCESR